jgi:hypothetical protein
MSAQEQIDENAGINAQSVFAQEQEVYPFCAGSFTFAADDLAIWL